MDHKFFQDKVKGFLAQVVRITICAFCREAYANQAMEKEESRQLLVFRKNR